MSQEKSFLRGLLLGGLVGAVAALLYAPKSGKEMRRDIKRKSRELYEDAEGQFEDLKEKAEDIIEDGKRQAAHLRRQAEKKMQEAREAADDLVASGRELVSDYSGKSGEKIAEAKAQAQSIIEEGKKKFGSGKDKLKSAMDAGVQAFRDEVDDAIAN